MKIIIDAKNGRIGFSGDTGSKKVEWHEIDRDKHRFLDILNQGLLAHKKRVEDIEHVFVFQKGATFSDARAGVILANTLMFAGQVTATIIDDEVDDVRVLDELAKKARKSELSYLEVQYSAAPSVTKPKKF